MSNFDPNFPNRDPRLDALQPRPAPSGWTLGIGVAVVALVIGFLAFGNNHKGDTTASAPPGAPTAMNPNPAPNASPMSPATATLPAARTPSETTGSAPKQ